MSSSPISSTPSGLPDLSPLPRSIRSMDGQDVDLNTDTWSLRVSADGGCVVTIKFSHLEMEERPLLSSRAFHLVKLYLADRLERKKAKTVVGDFYTFQVFARWASLNLKRPDFNWIDLTESIARAFLEYCVKYTADRGNAFSRLRSFYGWGVARQYPDFDTSLLLVLQSITAPGNSKGHHVRFRDPVRGPLSTDEKLLITRAIEADEGMGQDRAIVMLHLEVGMNPNSAARLRNKDLRRYEVEGEGIYQLDIPRVKKRTTQRETKRRPISRKLGDLLVGLQKGDPEAFLLHWLSETNPESGINQAMARFVKASRIASPHTGESLKLSARRLRYSLATDLAEDGASPEQIAEALDHTDTTNVKVYIETVSSITDRVAQATDQALVPLVRRFQGKVVDVGERSVAEGLSNQMIPASAPHLPFPVLNAGGIGMCERNPVTHGLCGLFPPLSCYQCPSFAALRNGPHRSILESIERFIEERKEQMDERTAAQLSDIQLAIKEVLAQLEPALGCRKYSDSESK
jgi:integrase